MRGDSEGNCSNQAISLKIRSSGEVNECNGHLSPVALSSLKFTFHTLPFSPAKLSLATDAAFFLAFIHHVVQLLKEVDKLLRVALFACRFRQFSPVICKQGTKHRCSSCRTFVISTRASGLPRRQGLDFQKDMRTSEEVCPWRFCQTVSSFVQVLPDDCCYQAVTLIDLRADLVKERYD